MKRNFTNSSVCFAIAYNEIICPGRAFFKIVFFEAGNFTDAASRKQAKKNSGCIVRVFVFLLFKKFTFEELLNFFFFKNGVAAFKALLFCE